MAKLTQSHILKYAKTHPNLKGADFAWDEPCKCIITLRDGITWNALDNNRHVEGFVFDDSYGDERDTVEYFTERLRSIEPEK
jgi:hypothetical protein